MNKILKLVAAYLATIVLSGCATSVGDLSKSVDAQLAKIKGATATTQSNSSADDYIAWARTDMLMVQQITELQKRAGLGWLFHERTLVIKNSVSGVTRKIQSAADLVFELPSDAVHARHASVQEAVGVTAEFVANMRHPAEASQLVIKATDAATLSWLMAIAKKSLGTGPGAQTIDGKIGVTNAIGWASTNPVLNRTL